MIVLGYDTEKINQRIAEDWAEGLSVMVITNPSCIGDEQKNLYSLLKQVDADTAMNSPRFLHHKTRKHQKVRFESPGAYLVGIRVDVVYVDGTHLPGATPYGSLIHKLRYNLNK